MDSRVFKVVGVLAALLLVSGFFAGPVLALDATVVQELTGPFDNPEGSVIALNGKHVFVSNAAAVGGSFGPDGYITKLKIKNNGTLKVKKAQFVTGLTRPWGMAVLPVNVPGVKAGTVFVGALGLDEDVQSQVVAFKPSNGKILGAIKAGSGSAFEAISGGPVLAINALAFDQDGNLYFTDTALGYSPLDCIPIRQGVWKVEADSLDALLDGGTDTAGVSFSYMAGAPDGIEVSPTNQLYANTVGGAASMGFGLSPLYDPFTGAVYLMTDADFVPPAGGAGEPYGFVLSLPGIQGEGALDGLVFTPDGLMLCTELFNNKLIAVDVDVDPWVSDDVVIDGLSSPLNGPADISVFVLDDDTYVIIPEHTSFADPPVEPEDDRVTVIVLD